MKKIIPLMLVFSLALIAATTAVSACSCIYHPEDTQANYDSAQVIFSGKAVGVLKMESYPVQQKATFEVYNYWKGENIYTEIILENYEDDGANCGYTIDEGEEYLIYAYVNEETGKISTSSCAGSVKLEKAQNEIEDLNEITLGNEPTQQPPKVDDTKNVFSRFFSWIRNIFS